VTPCCLLRISAILAPNYGSQFPRNIRILNEIATNRHDWTSRAWKCWTIATASNRTRICNLVLYRLVLKLASDLSCRRIPTKLIVRGLANPDSRFDSTCKEYPDEIDHPQPELPSTSKTLPTFSFLEVQTRSSVADESAKFLVGRSWHGIPQ